MTAQKLNRRTSITLIALFIGVSFLLPACIGTARKASQDTAKAIFPARDEVLIFHRAVDYTYLRVLDAVLSTPYWTLYETDKREGLIRAYNEKWGDPYGPMEQRIATIRVKRLTRDRTAVELDPASQTLIGVDDLMRAIKEFMNR